MALGVGEARVTLGKRTARSRETPSQSARGLMDGTCIQTGKWDLAGQSQGSTHALQQAGSPGHLFGIFRYLMSWVLSLLRSPSTLEEEHHLEHITMNATSIQLSRAAAAQGGETEAESPAFPTPLGCSSTLHSSCSPAAS